MGGLRSGAILASITRDRFRSVARERASRTIGDLRWLPAQAGSIQLDDQRTTWNSGHVSAVLSNGTAVVAGTQTGGVWLINPIPSPSFRGGYPATPLSDRWTNPSVYSLAYGPDGTQHVFVGCEKADSLMLLELQEVTGAVIARQTDLAIPLPSRTTVFSIVVIENPRRIVIGTERGVLWSDVPAATIDVDSYDWKEAAGLPDGTTSGLARCLGVSIVAGASDRFFAEGKGKQPVARLFTGDWQEGVLAFEPAIVPEITRSSTFGYKVASSRDHRDRVYATAYNDEDAIRCVLRSDDGGHTWAEVAMPQNAGVQGLYNSTIGASPYRPDVVALGWQMGTFLSTNGGESWELLTGQPGTDPNGLPCRGSATSLHHDVHAVHFPLNSLEADHLLIGSDGGLIATRDLGRCFDSEYSRGLAALQFYGPWRNTALAAGHVSKNGTLTVSSRYPGLLAGGTQDNGNVYLYRDTDAGSTWHKLVGGDGGLTRFVDPLSALLHRSNGTPAVRMAIWNDAEHEFNGEGTIVPKENDAAGLEPPAMETVVDPAWRRGGQLLYACAGMLNGDVYGLFADADAGNARFLPIANVGRGVSAISSLTGETILVGCADGSIVAVDSLSGAATAQPQDDNAPAGSINHIEVLSPTLAYALKAETLLRFNGQRWTALADQQWVLFTAERGSGRLFAATTHDVFSSADGGLTWSDASAGLPVSPNCSSLRIGDDGDGGRTLYLSTYGRSVWRAPITLPPGKGLDIDLPPLVKDALVGIVQDGGGIVRIGGRLTRIRPRGPSVDLLAAMAILETARTMSPESAREIEKTTLEQMAHIIRRAIEEIG
jgi:hypothetical protein